MLGNPKITITIPTYNRADLLPRAIKSVLNQTYQNFELIIVDDGSMDNTEEVVKPFLKDKRVCYSKLSENKGVLAAWNRGFDLAGGKLFTFVGSDDELLPEALEIAINKFDELSSQGIKYIMFNRIDSQTKKPTGYGISEEGFVNYKDMLCGKVHGNFWEIIDRRLISNDRFDERLWGNESILLNKWRRKAKMYYIPQNLYIEHSEHKNRFTTMPIEYRLLPRIILTMSVFLKEYGEEVRRLCPKIYGKHLKSLGYYQILNGEKSSGLKTLVKALKYNFCIKTLKSLILSLFLNKEQLRTGNYGFLSPIRKIIDFVRKFSKSK